MQIGIISDLGTTPRNPVGVRVDGSSARRVGMRSTNELVGSAERGFRKRTKSSCFRLVIGLRSHCVRLTKSPKPDCRGVLRRKSPQSLPAASSRTLSLVRFQSKSCEVAPISCNFQSNPGGFLCTSDCMAEGEGFEPPVPFRAHRFSRPTVSTAHTSLRAKKSLPMGAGFEAEKPGLRSDSRMAIKPAAIS
jgi:hypothetical protein